MPRETGRAGRRGRYDALIHQLNQRYAAEWVRAQRLQNELTAVTGSRLWRATAWIRRVRAWLRPRPATAPAVVGAAVPYRSLGHVPAARVSIVIPFRDRSELLRNCLHSLRTGLGRRAEVVLVDHGSTDPATARLLARLRLRRWVRIVSSTGAFNFSRLCNTGAREASGDHLLFLNNDTEVLAPDWLDHLLQLVADPAVGVAGATLLYPDHTIQHVGMFPRADGLWVHPHRGEPAATAGASGELRSPRSVPAVTGACMLIRRDVFDAVGGFDERYPVAYGDVDLCRRVRDRGLLVVVSPDARLLHYEALSRGYGDDRPGGTR